jgi:hypothetical protein
MKRPDRGPKAYKVTHKEVSKLVFADTEENAKLRFRYYNLWAKGKVLAVSRHNMRRYDEHWELDLEPVKNLPY